MLMFVDEIIFYGVHIYSPLMRFGGFRDIYIYIWVLDYNYWIDEYMMKSWQKNWLLCYKPEIS